MFSKRCLLFLLNALSILGNRSSRSYIKQGNIYSRLIEHEGEKPTISQGYVETANSALIEYKNRNVSAETLNKFLIGLEQYFSLKVYHKDDTDIIENSFKLFNISEPISLPVAIFEDISFYKAEAFGHPLYKNNINVLYDGSPSPYEYLLNATIKSDVIIFTGYFDINQTTYYFVYKLKNATYQSHVIMVRGYKRPFFVKVTLDLINEDLIHTYDSANENYSQINELIQKRLINTVEQIYLPYLDHYIYENISVKIAKKGVQYLSQYRKSVISTLIESGVNYISGKQLSSFEVKPLNFTKPVGDKVFVQTYKNIKVRGILNFARSKLGNSTIELDDRKEYKISEEVEFCYPQDGEKLAFIEFIVGDGMHLVPKKFKIKGIKVIAVYNASAHERPVKVRRNKKVFLNNSGFLIKFDLENYDPAYEFLYRHVSNDISRAIESVLATEGA